MSDTLAIASILRGIIPVFQTPFSDDDSVDEMVLHREIDWIFANGADGIAMALASELLRLSTPERDQLAISFVVLPQGSAPS